MTWSHLHKETGRLVGDPEDDTISELTGEAPLCEICRGNPAVRPVDNRDLCELCIEDLEGSDEPPGRNNTESATAGETDHE